MDVDLDGATWRKSTYSNGSGGNCVEVADLPSGRAVRDSKHLEGPILVFTRGEWQAFVQGIRAGELCAELEPDGGHVAAPGLCSRSSVIFCIVALAPAARFSAGPSAGK